MTSPTLAAQGCQGDGYLSLTQEDGTGFKNAGECVSYAAHGGQFNSPPKSGCTVTDTTGCITFDNEQLSDGQGHTVTVSGAFSFDSSCSCSYSLPNGLATGEGTYTETDSSGTTIASGTLTAAGDSTIYEGLVEVSYNGSTCSQSTTHTVNMQVSVDNATTLAPLYATTGDSPSSLLVFENQPIPFTGLASNVTIDC